MSGKEQDDFMSRLLTVRVAINSGEPFTFDAILATCEKQGLSFGDVILACRIMRALGVVRCERWGADSVYVLNR